MSHFYVEIKINDLNIQFMHKETFILYKLYRFTPV